MNVRMQLLLLAPICMALHLVYAESEARSCSNYCRGITPDKDINNAWELYVCGNKLLGPRQLPTELPLSTFVTNYDRFAGLTPGEFLDEWTEHEGARKGKYRYPEHKGFELDIDRKIISANVTILAGTLVDRFGPDTGESSPLSSPHRTGFRFLCRSCSCSSYLGLLRIIVLSILRPNFVPITFCVFVCS